ncbi:hypothetical protein OPQ81_008325 [Rhizoctonia solani]|nr:hypothetical protein OPQ81_008325 [Rhizoctonia solani]
MGDLALKPESIAEDVKNLRTWASRFNPTVIFRQYCDQEGFRRADDRKIRKALRHSWDHPTLFYSKIGCDVLIVKADNSHEVAGHTHRRLGTGIQPSGDELVYLPSDCLESHLPGEYKDISYEEMRQILLRKPRTEALVACYCDNFLQLPYVLEWDGNEMLWKRTEYCDIFPEDSGDVVHLAATGPNEPAVCYRDKGALFTYALYCIDPMEPLSLKTIGKRLRDNVAIISRAAGESTDKLCAQHPKVYASRKMNDPHFFQALGFYYPSDLDSGVRGDSN